MEEEKGQSQGQQRDKHPGTGHKEMKHIFLVTDRWAVKTFNKMTVFKDNTHFNLKTCNKYVCGGNQFCNF